MTVAGVLFMIVLVSFGLGYKTLRKAAVEDETHSQQQSVLIWTFSYLIFILPIAVIELLPEAVSNSAFISVSIFLCYIGLSMLATSSSMSSSVGDYEHV